MKVLLLGTLLLLIFRPAICVSETLTVGVYEDLILKEQRSRAERVLGLLIQLIGEQVGVKTELVLMPSGSRQAMLNASDAIRQGRVHLVVLTAVEYGWLRENVGQQVAVMAVSDPGIQAAEYEELIVRADADKKPSDLRGATLAVYNEPYPSAPIYLRQLQQEFGQDFLSRHTELQTSGSAALQTVLAGNADAAIIDLYTMQGYQRVFPGQVAKLKILGRSPPYPLVPIAGSESKVNSLRPDLWRKVQSALVQIHLQAKARAFLDVWRVRRFVLPPAGYDSDALKAAHDYPIALLPIE